MQCCAPMGETAMKRPATRDKYLALQRLILDKLEQGVWTAGGKLPGARQLAQEADCSFTHLQSVLESMVQQGVLVSVPRSGTYVREHWETRLLPGSLRLYESLVRNPFYVRLGELLGREIPEVRITGRFERGVYEILASHHLLGNSGQYLDLRPVFEKVCPDPSRYHVEPLKPYFVNGKLCGVPLLFSPRIVVYNRRMFADAGLAAPRRGWGWDDFMACLGELRRRLPAGKVMQFTGQINEFFTVAARFGGRFIEPGPDGEVLFDSPATLRGLGAYLAMRDAIGAASRAYGYEGQALWVTTRQQLSVARHHFPGEDFGGVELPLPPGGDDVNVQGMELFCVRRECADPALTERLLGLLLSPAMQHLLGRFRYGIPLLRDAAAASLDPADAADAVFYGEAGKPLPSYNLISPELYNLSCRAFELISREPGDAGEATLRRLADATRLIQRCSR